MSSCAHCAQQFTFTQHYQDLLDKIAPVIDGIKQSIPAPALCPSCRRQNVYAFRNERKFYARQCDLCHKNIISLYQESAPHPVYCKDCWWSDKWDRANYSKPYDFDKTFLQNFADLLKITPRLAIINSKSENSEYTNYSDKNKNCYMLVGTGENEDCAWCYRTFRCRDVHDSAQIMDSELCYECIDCEKLYDCSYCQNCSNSKYLKYCFDCKACDNCYGCANLFNKSYHFFNKPYSKEEYEKMVVEHITQNRGWEIFKPVKSKAIKKNLRIQNSESSSGDNLVDDKDCTECFNVSESRDCIECYYGHGNTDCFDMGFFDNNQLCASGASMEKNYNVIFSFLIWYCKDVSYSMECFNSSNIFGCLGLNHKEYCILNKQYEMEEYFMLVKKIIEQMRKTKQWGAFFPSQLSPFAYNETIAREYFPLSQSKAEQQDLKWIVEKEPEEGSMNIINAKDLPATIKETNDDIITYIIKCEQSGKLFKVQKPELTFYRKMNIPIPRLHPDQRHKARIELTNPHKLYARPCAKCQAPMQTTYAPDRPEKVYCEKCYLAAVY